MLPCEVDGSLYVRGVTRPDDDRGSAIDHQVPHVSCCLVIRVGRRHDTTTKLSRRKSFTSGRIAFQVGPLVKRAYRAIRLPSPRALNRVWRSSAPLRLSSCAYPCGIRFRISLRDDLADICPSAFAGTDDARQPDGSRDKEDRYGCRHPFARACVRVSRVGQVFRRAAGRRLRSKAAVPT